MDSRKWQINELNGPELSSASGSCPSELQAQSQSEALEQTLGSLLLSLFALAQGCAEPQQAANTIHLFIKFHFLERKERKGKKKGLQTAALQQRHTILAGGLGMGGQVEKFSR